MHLWGFHGATPPLIQTLRVGPGQSPKLTELAVHMLARMSAVVMLTRQLLSRCPWEGCRGGSTSSTERRNKALTNSFFATLIIYLLTWPFSSPSDVGPGCPHRRPSCLGQARQKPRICPFMVRKNSLGNMQTRSVRSVGPLAIVYVD